MLEVMTNLQIPDLDDTMNQAGGDCTADNIGRMFTHLGHVREIEGLKYSDEAIAHSVRMLNRNDWHHEAKVCMARDRILCLVAEKAALIERVTALQRQLESLTPDVK